MKNMYQIGATAVYIALIVAILIVSSALILGRALSVQLRLSQDIVSTERAFYAANAGVEEALYELIQNNAGESTIDEGVIEYDDRTANYSVDAHAVTQGPDVFTCISSLGEYAGVQRRANLGSDTVCE